MSQPFNPVERLGDGNGPLVLTCEHASNRVPGPLTLDPRDAPWLQTHWGWDIGAADLTRALARRTGADAVLSNFSRLVCDPNRSPSDPTWIRPEVEGHRLALNHQLDGAERDRRRLELHEPYHAAVDELLRVHQRTTSSDFLLLSVHSFTRSYLGQQRKLQAGVLFDDHPTLALALMNALRLQALDTRLNEPYSGMQGMIHSVSLHGHAHGVRYLELELRNDLIDTPAKADGVAEALARALSQIRLGRA